MEAERQQKIKIITNFFRGESSAFERLTDKEIDEFYHYVNFMEKR
jgi:hypothetical protein